MSTVTKGEGNKAKEGYLIINKVEYNKINGFCQIAINGIPMLDILMRSINLGLLSAHSDPRRREHGKRKLFEHCLSYISKLTGSAG